MKRMVMASLVAAQIVAVQPAAAAKLTEDRAETPQRGGFAGASLRIPLGERSGPVRAGLAIAPLSRSRETGAVSLRPGLEMGLSGAGQLQFAAGGRDVTLDQKRRAGVSTLGWVAIGAGALLVVTAIAAASAYAEIIDCDDDEECN